MTKAKCAVIFLKCMGCLIAAETIDASRISISKNGCIVIECNIDSFAGNRRAYNSPDQVLTTTVQVQIFPAAGTGSNQSYIQLQ